MECAQIVSQMQKEAMEQEVLHLDDSYQGQQQRLCRLWRSGAPLVSGSTRPLVALSHPSPVKMPPPV